MLSDLKFSLRQVTKNPGFSIVAVLMLALGIGINAMVFGFVRALVVQPIVRERQDRLTSLYSSGTGAGRDFRRFSYPEFGTIRNSHEIFADVAAFGFEEAVVGRADNFRRSLVGIVTENYFSLLHVQPAEGREFSAGEARPGANVPVAIAAHAYWESLGSPADFLGSHIMINSRPYTIIGVMPSGGGDLTSIGPEIWVPLGMASQILGGRNAPADYLGARTYRLSLIGSLQSGLTRSQAAAQSGVITRRLNAPPLGDPSAPRLLMVEPLPRFSLGNDDRPPNEGFLIPFAAIGIGLAIAVLLVTSLNLSNMMLARGMSRQKEIAVRMSLGASRWRIVRQLFGESLLLAAAGGVLGVLFSNWTGIYLRRLVIIDFSVGKFAFSGWRTKDAWDFAAVAVLAAGSALVFGLGPAYRAARVNLIEDLKRQPGDPTAGGSWNRFFSPRHCLMMAQVALSFMLLFSAALFVRGAQQAMGLSPGFRTDGELVLNLDYVDPGLSGAAIATRQQNVLVRARSVPGVEEAALSSTVPFNYDTNWWTILPAAGDAAALNSADKSTHPYPVAVFSVASRGYFQTLGIPLQRGRDFSEAESSQHGGHPVAIISANLAYALFGDKDPLGRRIATNSEEADIKHPERGIEIVGIVHSSHEDPFEASAPRRIYRPLGQFRRANIYLHVRISDPAGANAILDRLRTELRSLDPDTPIVTAQPLSDFIDKNISLLLVRLAGIVFGLCGLVALAVAVIGIYAVKAHAVVRRTREIGIRIALGAGPGDVLALIVKQGVWQTAAGLGVGLVLALGAGRLLSNMLYHVSPVDPLALAAAALLLAFTALLACFLPARRATRVDPAITLRAE